MVFSLWSFNCPNQICSRMRRAQLGKLLRRVVPHSGHGATIAVGHHQTLALAIIRATRSTHAGILRELVQQPEIEGQLLRTIIVVLIASALGSDPYRCKAPAPD